VAHCDAFRLDHTSQSQTYTGAMSARAAWNGIVSTFFYIYHEIQWVIWITTNVSSFAPPLP
jgi:hypothetical protein